MKRELMHFQIGDSYGGNQDWFPTFMMRVGGCGAETACDSSIYFALHRGLHGIAPENASALTKEDYVRFAYEMKPYLSPRMSGIDRLDIYLDGYAAFLKDHGETRLQMTEFPGTEEVLKAKEAVIRQIDGGFPVPMLVLNHKNKDYEDYVWHWFLLNGYDDSEGSFLVKAVTYSRYRWLDFETLWDTGHERRGGLVLYHLREDRPGKQL
ncbi:MAG: hypothetical protein J6Y95_02565 [Lachnospiraceae bacterium]|nr:hypothetical protein [Lachnospiraceae bacterium]